MTIILAFHSQHDACLLNMPSLQIFLAPFPRYVNDARATPAIYPPCRVKSFRLRSIAREESQLPRAVIADGGIRESTQYPRIYRATPRFTPTPLHVCARNG